MTKLSGYKNLSSETNYSHFILLIFLEKTVIIIEKVLLDSCNGLFRIFSISFTFICKYPKPACFVMCIEDNRVFILFLTMYKMNIKFS